MISDGRSYAWAGEMKLVMIGAPGSGKSTQAGLLCRRLHLKHIYVGDLLRREMATDSPFAERIRTHLSRGLLVPEDIVLAVLKRELSTVPDDFVLDGFPRTLQQVLDLESILSGRGQSLDAAIYLHVSSEEILRRLLMRGRPDDRPSVILKRIEVFHQQADPVLRFYEDKGILLKVVGEGDPVLINANIIARVEEHVRRLQAAAGYPS